MLQQYLPPAYGAAILFIDQGAALIHELGHIFNERPDLGGSRIGDDAGRGIVSGNNTSIVYNNCVRPIFPMIPKQDENLRPILAPFP